MNSLPSFADFFESLWGYAPFPWQTRLAERLATGGKWPACLALPTGTGKTTALDIAIHHLASQAHLPPEARAAPVRIVFAVNRRIVVDEAYERVKTIAAKLAVSCGVRTPSDFDEDEDFLSPEDVATLLPIAESLQRISGIDSGLPLETYPLRGATFTDHSWARTPTQPLVLTTTLDQLGSRLLFRGYGVSPYARPLHAALLANDALLILDEAHTASAFSQTLSSIERLRAPEDSDKPEALNTPFAAVQLTATPPADLQEQPFDLYENDNTNPIIAKRLNASKPASLMPVAEGAKGASRHTKLGTRMAESVTTWLDDETGPRHVLVVVNRVATAEALHTRLAKSRGKKHDVHLLTGRIRPLDRDRLIGDLQSHLGTAETPANGRKLVLVATQTVEVGADYDFDALATELAPLDSLRQRFGRLNRTGRDVPAPAAIFAPEEALDEKKSDPLYGDCLPRVWKWLQHQADTDTHEVDFGLAAMRAILPTGDLLTPLLAPSSDAPILLSPHLDLLCQTSPEPHVSPDPAIYIHGPGRNFAEVGVVLRADLPDDENQARALLDTFPPLGTETATIPLSLARDWLADAKHAAKNPAGDAPEDLEHPGKNAPTRLVQAYRFHHGEASRLANTRNLAPGDTLILPVDAIDDDLESLLPLPQSGRSSRWHLDHYERAALLARDRLTLRFHPAMRDHLASNLSDEDVRARFLDLVQPLFAEDEDDGRWRFDRNIWEKTFPEIATLLATNLEASHPLRELWEYAAWRKKDPENPRPIDDWRIVPIGGEKNIGAVLTNRSRVCATPWPIDPESLGRQGDETDKRETLDEHSEAVTRRAETNARPLPAFLREAITRAARHHDLGKLDPRFQSMLRGRTPLAVTTRTAPLAKSASRNRALARHYREKAGLPENFRHELLSTLAADLIPDIRDHPERDLILHLIASHHGRCRAMAPVVPDAEPEPFELTVKGDTVTYPGTDAPLAHIASGVTSRFWSLTRRFGWWGLPYLEAQLRLADQYESANPPSK